MYSKKKIYAIFYYFFILFDAYRKDYNSAEKNNEIARDLTHEFIKLYIFFLVKKFNQF